MDFTISKDYTMAKAKADVKAEAVRIIFDALVKEYGEENVAMVRTGGASKTNEIAAIVGTADVKGEKVPVCITVNPSAKDFIDRKTDKKTFTAFDFYEAKAEYMTYTSEKAEKDAEKAAAKAKKIEKDTAAREKAREKAKETANSSSNTLLDF